MNFYLLLAAIIIIICVMFNKLSSKVGVPTLLLFIVLGMVFGSDGLFKIPFENYESAEGICTIALIFIMFYGGFGTRLSEAKPIAQKSILLSSVGVVITAGLTGLFCHFVLNIDLLKSFLIGSVICSTDAASVFSILRSKKLNLKYNTASMLEVESGSNDPIAYMLTIILISVINGKASSGFIAYLIFAEITYGLIIGVAVGYAGAFVLRRFKFSTEGFDAAFMFALVMISYSLPVMIHGNGYLSVYIAGTIMGNAHIKNKQSLVHFFDGITGLMQMLIFFLMGLLATPSQLPAVMIPAIAIALFLTFVARPAAVFAVLAPAKSKINQMLFVSFAGLRGAASIVFAMIATVSVEGIDNSVFNMTFFIVLLSIAVQGTLIPFVADKVNMIDDSSNVLRTFNDYSEKTDVQFIKIAIPESSPWIGKELRDIVFPPDLLVVMIIRDKEIIVPSGSTKFCENDHAILGAPVFDDQTTLHLVELKLNRGNEWIGRKISEFSPDPEQIVIMIKRDEKIIIPKGKTILEENDVLVMNYIDVYK